METAIERWTKRGRFAAGAALRTAWFAGESFAMKRYVRRFEEKNDLVRPRVAKPAGRVPGEAEMLADIARLHRRDLANAEAGRYPLPDDLPNDPAAVLATTRAFFADVEAVSRRRVEGTHQDPAKSDLRGKRPRYWLQNFHFQTDGWTSPESAAIYDHQVEVLFTGATPAMRRQGLVPVATWIAGRDQRRLKAADLGTGTGSFARELLAAYPRLKLTGVDLSEAYLGEARRRLDDRPTFAPLLAAAEALPFADASLDLVSVSYLFHELPPKIRRAVAGEIARVLKPGGLVVIVDSLQSGDRPDYDGLLELFPQLFHEPYYAGYLNDDLGRLFARRGFSALSDRTAFLSKIAAFTRN